MTRLLLILTILLIPNLGIAGPDLGRLTSYQPGMRVMVGVGCDTEPAIMDMTQAAQVSREKFLEAQERHTGICGALSRPMVVTLDEKLLQFTGYENDLIEVWRGMTI